MSATPHKNAFHRRHWRHCHPAAGGAVSLAAVIVTVLPSPQASAVRTAGCILLALMIGGLSLARALRGTDLSDEVIRACRTLGAAAARGASNA